MSGDWRCPNTAFRISWETHGQTILPGAPQDLRSRQFERNEIASATSVGLRRHSVDIVWLSFSEDGLMAMYFATILGDLIHGPISGSWVELGPAESDGRIAIELDDFEHLGPFEFDIIVARSGGEALSIAVGDQLCNAPELSFARDISWLVDSSSDLAD